MVQRYDWYALHWDWSSSWRSGSLESILLHYYTLLYRMLRVIVGVLESLNTVLFTLVNCLLLWCIYLSLILLLCYSSGFTTFRSFLLITDSDQIERHSLMIRQMKRLLAPQIQENPIFFHGTDASLEGAKKTIDNISGIFLILCSYI